MPRVSLKKSHRQAHEQPGAPDDAPNEPREVGDALGITYQQIQKYEKGTNRISASKLQQSANILQIPVEFFFEGAPRVRGAPQVKGTAPSRAYVAGFLATSDGLAHTKAFTQIKGKKLRRCIADLVESIADQ
jgi:transcriptional regulator with XRE-family HTH domain